MFYGNIFISQCNVFESKKKYNRITVAEGFAELWKNDYTDNENKVLEIVLFEYVIARIKMDGELFTEHKMVALLLSFCYLNFVRGGEIRFLTLPYNKTM